MIERLPYLVSPKKRVTFLAFGIVPNCEQLLHQRSDHGPQSLPRSRPTSIPHSLTWLATFFASGHSSGVPMALYSQISRRTHIDARSDDLQETHGPYAVVERGSDGSDVVHVARLYRACTVVYETFLPLLSHHGCGRCFLVQILNRLKLFSIQL